MLNTKKVLTDILQFIKRKDYTSVGTEINITGYSSSSNLYTVPSDGYVKIQATYRANSYITLFREGGEVLAQMSSPGTSNAAGNLTCSTPVCKGMKVYITSNSQYNYAGFVPYA